jgi:hypothetical protein
MEKKTYEMYIDENDIESGIQKISLVADPAIMEGWIFLSANKKPVELKTLNEEKRLVVGPALIPNIKIPRIDDKTKEEYYITFPESTIELASQLYLKRMHIHSANIEHSEDVDGVSLVESWIIQNPQLDKATALGFDLPKGTWMTALKIDNDNVWEEYVKTGVVKGFSIEGALNHREVAMSQSEDDKVLAELKKLLQDYRETLGDTQTEE